MSSKSNSPFGDMAALKALKKELEAQEAPATEKIVYTRKKTITLKTREQIQGEQKAREEGLRPGMRVTLMDSCDRGVIKAIHKDRVDIELDEGFTVPVAFNGFIVNDADEDRLLMRGTGRSKAKDEAEDGQTFHKSTEIDLHVEAIPGGLQIPDGQQLPFQLEYFKKTLRSLLKHRGSRVIFIHGVGDGKLKEAVRSELDSTFAISCTWVPYGSGATAVTIR